MYVCSERIINWAGWGLEASALAQLLFLVGRQKNFRPINVYLETVLRRSPESETLENENP